MTLDFCNICDPNHFVNLRESWAFWFFKDGHLEKSFLLNTIKMEESLLELNLLRLNDIFPQDEA